MKISFYIIVALIITTVSLNLLILIDKELAGYFRWVNAYTGFSLMLSVLLTWLAKRHLDKQKTSYVHQIFSKN